MTCCPDAEWTLNWEPEDEGWNPLAPLSVFFIVGLMLWGWRPIPVELRGPGTYKSSLNIIGQNVTVQTPNVSENLPYQPSEKMTMCWRSCPHSQMSSHFQSSVLETWLMSINWWCFCFIFVMYSAELHLCLLLTLTFTPRNRHVQSLPNFLSSRG